MSFNQVQILTLLVGHLKKVRFKFFLLNNVKNKNNNRLTYNKLAWSALNG